MRDGILDGRGAMRADSHTDPRAEIDDSVSASG